MLSDEHKVKGSIAVSGFLAFWRFGLCGQALPPQNNGFVLQVEVARLGRQDLIVSLVDHSGFGAPGFLRFRE